MFIFAGFSARRSRHKRTRVHFVRIDASIDSKIVILKRKEINRSYFLHYQYIIRLELRVQATAMKTPLMQQNALIALLLVVLGVRVEFC